MPEQMVAIRNGVGVWQGVMLPTFRELVFVAVISRRVGPAFVLPGLAQLSGNVCLVRASWPDGLGLG